MTIRTSIKWIVVVVIIIFFDVNAKAQAPEKAKWLLNFGLEGGIPTGNFHIYPAYSRFEMGGTAQVQYGASNYVALTLTTGYYNFFPTAEAKSQNDGNFGIIPIKAGIKGFPIASFYLGAEAGAGFETVFGKNAKLIFSPALGWANHSWDVGIRYESLSGRNGAGDNDNYGVVALRLAYGFALK
jgi:hypothetical protein